MEEIRTGLSQPFVQQHVHNENFAAPQSAARQAATPALTPPAEPNAATHYYDGGDRAEIFGPLSSFPSFLSFSTVRTRRALSAENYTTFSDFEPGYTSETSVNGPDRPRTPIVPAFRVHVAPSNKRARSDSADSDDFNARRFTPSGRATAPKPVESQRWNAATLPFYSSDGLSVNSAFVDQLLTTNTRPPALDRAVEDLSNKLQTLPASQQRTLLGSMLSLFARRPILLDPPTQQKIENAANYARESNIHLDTERRLEQIAARRQAISETLPGESVYGSTPLQRVTPE